MDHGRADNAAQARQRQQMIDYVSTTEWAGWSVLDLCQRCRYDDLLIFVAALKSGRGPIPLGFRWAVVDDTYLKQRTTS